MYVAGLFWVCYGALIVGLVDILSKLFVGLFCVCCGALTAGLFEVCLSSYCRSLWHIY